MRSFWSVIFIICVQSSLECSGLETSFDTLPNGDVVITVNDSISPLKISFNPGNITKKLAPDHVGVYNEGNSLQLNYPGNTKLSFSKWCDECVVFNYSTNNVGNLYASINISGVYMYGGAEENERLTWPLGNVYYDEAFVSKFKYDEGVLEPYWLLSNGYYIYVDNRVPLFVDKTGDKVFQLAAKKESPYVKHEKHSLNFTVCKLKDVYHAQQHAIQNFLGKPSLMPDKRLVTHPMWSTESKFGKVIDEKKILEFAQEIAKHKLAGQLRIDKTWEECPGSLKPNVSWLSFKNLISELKKLNFTVALTIDPYVNNKCNDIAADGVENDYFVKNDQGVSSVNGNDRFIDLTNPKARDWYLKRLQFLRETYGIDSFKLDSVFSTSPLQPPIYYLVAEDHPETIIKGSAKLLSSLGRSVQTSAARNIQKYGFYVRMAARAPMWNWYSVRGHNYGLRSIIPTLLQFNIIGYSFVVADKIGGSGDYDLLIKKRELYIRWVQLNVFMPTMEFSVPPWDFDDEVVSITKKFVNLHARYSHYILRLMEEHIETGNPINRPLWWIAPDDKEALKCDDEFLLGDDILVAPVIQDGQRSRDIYLPEGYWLDVAKSVLRVGPVRLSAYEAGLDVLPYFHRIHKDATKIRLLSEDGGI